MQEKNSETLKEFGRGLIGGLLFSLPLLYTMEMWWRGFTIDSSLLLICVVSTFILLIGYNTFSGMRKDASFREVLKDSVQELGLAFIFSFTILYLFGIISFHMPVHELAGKVIIETMVVSIGISVGTAQLGGGNSGSSMEKEEKSGEWKQILKAFTLGTCGAVLFATNVAPTIEIVKIALEASELRTLFLFIFTIFLSYAITFMVDFLGKKNKTKKNKMASLILLNCLIALIVSFALLLLFDRIQEKALEVIVSEVVVLFLPASIGASAGKVLITG